MESKVCNIFHRFSGFRVLLSVTCRHSFCTLVEHEHKTQQKYLATYKSKKTKNKNKTAKNKTK